MNPEELASTPKDDMSAYSRFLDVREKIMTYKWIASEKAGHDIGFETALLEWTALNDKEENTD